MTNRFSACLRLRASGVALFFATGLIGGCDAIGPQPWDRDLMAQQRMQLNPYPIEAAADDHIYFSKEGSSGGRAFAGGGCGCN
jgi:hypothetical protein